MSFPNLSLSPSERHAFAHFYKLAEKGNGIVSGESAVAFFSYSGLTPLQLGQIWQISDTNNNGFLDQQGFSVALRLIAHLQANETLTEDLINKPGPIPQFDGIPPPAIPQVSSPTNQPSISPIQTQQIPPVQVDERSRFTRIYAGCGPINGLLSGDKARDVFIKSKLPFDVLGQIWNLADTQNRGSLDLTDFIIGMHFIQCYMNKTISQLPSTLPPAVYEQASAGRQRSQSPLVSSPIQNQLTGGSQAGSPPPSRQVRFAAVGANDSPQSISAIPPVQTQPSEPAKITAEEKKSYDGFYDSLNPSGNGVLEADKAVDFFSKSGLPIEILANVWDLADVRKTGSLNKDEFAIAMYLIHGCLAGKPLPSTLPDNLIPSSLRSSAPRKPADDLFDLMGDESDLQPAVVQPQHSGGIQPAGIQPQHSGGIQTAGVQQQGTGLSSQSTGLSSQTTGIQAQPSAFQVPGWQNPPLQQQQPPQQARSPFENPSSYQQPALVDDLLGDSDVQQSKLNTDTEAVQSAKGQLSETDKALSDYQTRRADLETRVNTAETERKDLEQRLTNARKAHDTESKLVSELQVKLTETTAERRRLEQELITAESDCSAQKVERAELETAYMREKEETRVLKAKILEISNHTTEMRQALSEFQETTQASKGENEETKEQLRNAESERDNAAKELKRYSNVDPAETLPTDGEKELDEKLKDIEDSKQEPEVKPETLETPKEDTETAAENVKETPVLAQNDLKEEHKETKEIKETKEDTTIVPTTEAASAVPLPTSPESAQEEPQSVSKALSPSSTKSTNPFDNFSKPVEEAGTTEDPFAVNDTSKSAFDSFDDNFDKLENTNSNVQDNTNIEAPATNFDDAFAGFDSKPTDSKAAFDESFAPAVGTAPAASSADKESASPFDNFAPAVGATLPAVKGKERDNDSSDDDEGPEDLPELSEQPPNLNPKDDKKDEFEDAFSSFPTAPSQADAKNKNPFDAMIGNTGEKKDDHDDFDTSFADLPAAQIAAGNVPGENDDDHDSAFDFVADFDQPGTSNKQAPNKAFDDFSDTFSMRSPTSDQADNTAKPNLPPRAENAEEDDIKQVKQLVNMGFDRPQAVKALEKSGFNVEKALNSRSRRTVTIDSTKPTLYERRMKANDAHTTPRVNLPSDNLNSRLLGTPTNSSTTNNRTHFPRTPFASYFGRSTESTPLLQSHINPPSPGQSYFGSRSLGMAINRHRNKSKKHGYDDLYENDMVESGKGVRTYAHTHTSIDYIHDKVKEGVRLRRLLRKKGIRGFLEKSFDRAQGWFIVTIIGIVTAIIAFTIVRTEAWLFSFRDGYCSNSWLKSKQFCCNIKYTSHQDNFSYLSASMPTLTTDCPEWTSWEDTFGKRSSTLLNWTMAIAFAFISSIITVYISASNAPWVNDSNSARLEAYHHAASGRKQSVSSPMSCSPQPHPSLHSHRDSISSFLYSNGTNKTNSLHSHSLSRKSSSDDDNSLYSDSDNFEEELQANNDEYADQFDTTNLLSTPTAEKLQLTSPHNYPVMYFAAGSGIPEMKAILSGFVIRGYLGVCTLLCKGIGLAFSVASGLNLGKEGPMVQIAACVGNITSRYIRKFETNEAKRREIISASCAAGVSVAFGAPIGGVLFALEEISTYFPPKVMWRAFYCASLAAVTLKFLDPYGTGKTVLFEVTYDQDWKFFELPFFFIIAIAGGLYGAYFSKFNIWWGKNVRMQSIVKSHPIIEVVVITLITAVISSYNPLTEMGGTELVSTLLSECPSKSSGKKLKGIFATLCAREGQAPWGIIKTLSLAIGIKSVLTVITFGMKLPAGIFVPTLAVGACFGRMVGLVIEYWSIVQPDSALFGQCKSQSKCMLSAIYALIGAASALSGVTRMTISLVVIVCELTGTLNYVVVGDTMFLKSFTE
ncbi:hypothetical protein E3Q06_02990 [Wallemia mellicola]|nr:hypothetical protein E3Q21_03004 [Wallemia mellicola]TIB86028.1 hypothetical protein E3Q20_02995 [Wallemia mellicola]TIC39451.1 hypothetical protein E3Q07_03012 [Wallemia mellicola]TIC47637.1 hypothetical protein E3Q06_02990 [Wallemia mellicola]